VRKGVFQLPISFHMCICTECAKPPQKAVVDVRHVIMVLSGKGGVGKSTVSVNLAYSLSNHGFRVGLLDLDMHGPNIPKMLGIEDHKLAVMGELIEPVHVTSGENSLLCPWRFFCQIPVLR